VGERTRPNRGDRESGEVAVPIAAGSTGVEGGATTWDTSARGGGGVAGGSVASAIDETAVTGARDTVGGDALGEGDSASGILVIAGRVVGSIVSVGEAGGRIVAVGRIGEGTSAIARVQLTTAMDTKAIASRKRRADTMSFLATSVVTRSMY
jgi:hypothetical protein